MKLKLFLETFRLCVVLIFLTGLLIKSPARAEYAYAEPKSQSKSLLIYIAGFGKSPQEVLDAQKVQTEFLESPYAEVFDILSLPLLATAYQYTAVVAQNKTRIQELARKLTQPTEHLSQYQHLVIAGHSSGSVFAIELALELSKFPNNQNKKIELISLDGFNPHSKIQNPKITLHCWSARNQNMHSINFAYLQNCQHSYIVQEPRCTNSMCLHFALINKSSSSINRQNFLTIGYQGEINFSWLDPILSSLLKD